MESHLATMGWRTPKDPLLSTPRYRRNRETLKRMKLPCAVCRRAIGYDQPGQFHAGHIVPRHIAKRLGWSEAEINALSNLRPECRSCSNKTGTIEGNRAKRAMQQQPIYRLTDAHRW